MLASLKLTLKGAFPLAGLAENATRKAVLVAVGGTEVAVLVSVGSAVASAVGVLGSSVGA